MHPLVFGLPVYFLGWFAAAATTIPAGTVLGGRGGFSRGRVAAVVICCALSLLAGSKLLYLAETALFPFDDYVPPAIRGSLHGFRIPGGVLLLALAVPLSCRLFGLPWRAFGDIEAPVLAAGLIFIRLGCFLNGCCFGTRSSLPWAMSFPPESWVFRYQVSQGWLPAEAPSSLPVHPLQLYFVGAGALIFLFLLLVRRGRYSGERQLLFYTLFFTTTAFIEPFRANRLQLNTWVVSTAALVSAGLLVGLSIARDKAIAPSTA